MKDIKDYLHLYLNSGVVGYGGSGAAVALREEVLHLVKIEQMTFKPILRKLDSMTEEECLEVAITLGGVSHLSNESKIFQVRELFEGIYNKQTNIPGAKWIEVTRYLLSKSFDLFGLIAEGLAIDRATLTVKAESLE